MLKGWLRFFRVVNLPTVPGDVLAGAAMMLCGSELTPRLAVEITAASLASVLIYMFGLADNDIVGAKTDVGRPIPDGEISLGAARIARAVCLAGALMFGCAARLQIDWWLAVALLTVCVLSYNRTQNCVLMGLCRGFNVLAGVMVVGCCGASSALASLVLPAIWTLYIGWVTWYSKGEELDPRKRRMVGVFIGCIIYLQLLTLLVFRVEPLLLSGAALLILLRLGKRLLPGVSAS